MPPRFAQSVAHVIVFPLPIRPPHEYTGGRIGRGLGSRPCARFRADAKPCQFRMEVEVSAPIEVRITIVAVTVLAGCKHWRYAPTVLDPMRPRGRSARNSRSRYILLHSDLSPPIKGRVVPTGEATVRRGTLVDVAHGLRVATQFPVSLGPHERIWTTHSFPPFSSTRPATATAMRSLANTLDTVKVS